MNKAQYEAIIEWQDKTFLKATPLSCALHLEEEAKELRESIESGRIDEDEIADNFLLLFAVCNKLGFTYEKVVQIIEHKSQVCYTREWEDTDRGYQKHKKQ